MYENECNELFYIFLKVTKNNHFYTIYKKISIYFLSLKYFFSGTSMLYEPLIYVNK